MEDCIKTDFRKEKPTIRIFNPVTLINEKNI